MSSSSVLVVVPLAAALLLCSCKVENTCCAPNPPADGGKSPGDGGTLKDGGGSTVTLEVSSFDYPSITPAAGAWVAYQDGDGGWTQLAGADGGYAFSVKDAAGKYGVAVQCPGVKLIEMVLATVAEEPAVKLSCAPASPPRDAAVTFVSQHWPAGTTGAVVMLGNSTNLVLDADGSDKVFSVRSGVADLGAVAEVKATSRWSKGILRHNEPIADTNTENFDFNGGFSPIPIHFDTVGLTAADTNNNYESNLLTEGGAQLNLPTPTVAASVDADGIPASVELDTDRVVEGVFLANSTNSQRAAGAVYKSSQDATFTPPPYLSSVSITVRTGAHELLPSLNWTGAPLNSHYFFTILQAARTYEIAATHGAVGDPSSFELPDLTQVPGFDPVMTMDPAVTVIAAAYAFKYDGPVTLFLNVTAMDGRAFVVGQTFSYTASSTSYP